MDVTHILVLGSDTLLFSESLDTDGVGFTPSVPVVFASFGRELGPHTAKCLKHTLFWNKNLH